jgi:LacI family transcriptional regulator
MPPRRERATILDVASKAEVSPAAVSRYLNGSLTLPAQTAARIDNAVQTLNYKPNPHATRLVRGKSDALALVVPDIGNVFFAQLAAAVERAAAAHGLGVVLCMSENRVERELDYIERLSRNYVDGLLFITNHADDGTLAKAMASAGPVVLLDEDVGGAQAARVFTDNESGGALAARHLLSVGHRRLAYIGGPQDLMSARERAAGFNKAVQAIDPRAAIVEMFGDYSIEFGQSAMQRLIDEKRLPTAIFAASDHITFGMLETLRRNNLKVPRDISIVTFDDVAPLAFFDPPLTAIRQSVAEMGRRGVELMAGQRKGRKGTATVERLPVELIERESVGPPRRS